jgi:hypothetical protein
MLDLLNCIACLVLMGFSLPVAMVMGNRGMWAARLSMMAVVLGLFLQLTNPWVSWVPAVSWTGVYLNTAAAVMAIIWRRRGWLFVRSYLTPVEEEDFHLKRRRGDWPEPHL